jgi:hypothetical protein
MSTGETVASQPSGKRRSALPVILLVLVVLIGGGAAGFFLVYQPMVQAEKSKNNLQAIMAAVLKFHDDNKELPSGLLLPRGSAIGPKTKVQHFSWRVQILPNLGDEYRKLYDKFDLNQPWDSDHNLEVARQMPDIFRSPHQSPTTNHAGYLAIAGSEGAFPEGDQPLGRRGVSAATDGADQTAAIIEVQDSSIIWTQPRDLTVDEFAELLESGNLVGVAEITTPSTWAGMLDGSVRRLAKGLPAATARALATRAGKDKAELPGE